MKTRVLIAESDSRWCENHLQLLSERGYEIETASAGPECLRKISNFHPDLLILNLELPWGGGEAVLACMRDSRFDRFIPVVLTTSSSRQDLDNFLEPPVVKCLSKPIDPKTLLESIRFTCSPQEPILTPEVKDRPGGFPGYFLKGTSTEIIPELKTIKPLTGNGV